MNEEKHALEGLGGWLILIGFGLVFGPIRLLSTFGPMFYGIFTDGTWELLTSVASESYTPNIGILLIFELTVNAMLLLFYGLLIYLFFSKKAIFPKTYITFAILGPTLVTLDAYLSRIVIPDIEVWDQATIEELARSLPAVLIWTPYMLLSERVQRTFVR